tara:strand:+ start:870 stop:1424 length:555 start_codon:yes stop_codon:yes gene_type:complete
MAMSLKDYLNSKIKAKGSTLTKEKAKAKNYKSIAAAKKAGSLYYTNKDGKVMAAVYAGDLKKAAPKPIPRPKVRPKKKPGPLQGPTKNRGTLDEKVEVDKANKKPMSTAKLTKMVLVALGPAETKKSKTKVNKPRNKEARIAELKAEIRKLRTKIANARKRGTNDRRAEARIREIQGIIKRMQK